MPDQMLFCRVEKDLAAAINEYPVLRAPGFVFCPVNEGLLFRCSGRDVALILQTVFGENANSKYGVNAVILRSVPGLAEVRSQLAALHITLIDWYAPFAVWYANDFGDALMIPLAPEGFSAVVIKVGGGDIGFRCNSRITALELRMRLTHAYPINSQTGYWVKMLVERDSELNLKQILQDALEKVGFTLHYKSESNW